MFFKKKSLRSTFLWGAALLLVLWATACSSVADGEEIGGDDFSSSVIRRSSSSVAKYSSRGGDSSSAAGAGDSSEVADSSAADSSFADTSRVDSSASDSSFSEDFPEVEDALSRLDSMAELTWIPATKLSRGNIDYSVDSFAISKTEVTQSLYEDVMGKTPIMDKPGDSIAVANVNWYEAILFCNALSRKVGLDTVYVYESVGASSYLKNLTVDGSARGVRLPTETQWEIACRAGSVTTYYWDVNPASKYAYYAQTKGPSKVAQYLPNAYGLFDMGGNVAEWTHDWYGAYPSKDSRNYAGPEDGSYRVVRGGGWSDKVNALACGEREKKDPLYQSQMLGFRISVAR